MMDTPVPIPNTEVKHHNGDDSTYVQQQLAAGSFFYYLEFFIKRYMFFTMYPFCPSRAFFYLKDK